ncbi:MAG: hypothetical protein ACI8W8_002393 [Rhodothermales bacterium]|jgi:hypothetical protein
MNRDQDQLIAAYLAGEEVAEELLHACREAPELLGQLTEHSVLDRLLAVEPNDDAFFVAEVRARLEGRTDESFADGVRSRLPSGKRRFSPQFVTLAAASLILLGAAIFLPRHEPAIATLERVSGEVYIGADSRIEPASDGTSIPSGTELFCTPGLNEATVRLADGSLFTLASGTRVTFSRVDGQSQLLLSEGLLSADVEKQPEGRPLVIVTPDATVTVLGTRLTLCAASDSKAALFANLLSATTLVVDEGSVEMGKSGSSEEALVKSGETAVATAETTMQVERIDDLVVGSLEIIRASFGARSSWVDVTPQVRAHAADSRLITLGMIRNLASDPLPHIIKTLKIDYRIDDQAGSAEFSEVLGQSRTLRTELILPMPAAAQTTVSQAKVSSRAELQYAAEVSDSDLLHGLTADVRGWNSGNDANSTSLNDGIHGDTYAVESASSVAWTTSGISGASATFDLGLGAGRNGWDITGIQSIAAWVNAGFGNQAYIVETKGKDDRGFTVLATVDFQPLPNQQSGIAVDPGATRVSLSGDEGVLASRVQYIRFTANRVNGGRYGGTFTFREIDVFGVESVAAPRDLGNDIP